MGNNNVRSQNVLGFDIGGTAIKSCLLDPLGNVVKEFETPSLASEGPPGVKVAIKNILNYYQDSQYSGVGIGCAGSVDRKRGVVRASPNFSHWKDVPLVDWVKDISKKPVEIDNDANCAALAEHRLGGGQGYSNVILLTLGTGIGGGIVLNDQIYRGSTGSAAELGHISIYADGRECLCGNFGCFEEYCSGRALMKNAGKKSAQEVFESPNECHETLEKFFRDLSVGITSLANIFDPDCILLGGAVAKGVYPDLGRISDWVSKHAYPAVRSNVKILPAHFENQAGAIGAALLVNSY